ncbi:ribbon-helix-helix protein, CopG family [Dactylosporangium sp. NPDC050688]|uniref:ribbon-helix-helix protein, CopG family n=1 Tax=Dactylosporangium sp. NPDC050688 TaxID=3157217 RepID=UPI0033D4C990
MEQPDLRSMTDDQVAEWFATNDTSGLVGTGRPVAGQFVQVDETGAPVGRMVSLKMPAAMVDALDAAAGRDREGRSGIIRTAVEEWLARHADNGEAA